MMSLLELIRVLEGQATWRRITYVTKDAKSGPNLVFLICGGFKVSQIVFTDLRGGNTVVFIF